MENDDRADSARNTWLERAIAKISRLETEPSAQQPSPETIQRAIEILGDLFRIDWKPTSIVVNAEGGISLWLHKAGATIHIEVSA